MKRGPSSSSWFDMYVPFPTAKKDIDPELLPTKVFLVALLRRLKDLGYQGAALTVTKYGKPGVADEAENLIPTDLLRSLAQDPDLNQFVIKRRLHFVVENVSDVAHISGWKDHGYDFLSISPGNDTVFQSICQSTDAPSILTVDYTRGGKTYLPFAWKSSDLKAACRRGAAFEIPYSSFVLDPSIRRKVIKLCSELQMMTVGTRPRLLFSSGPRVVSDEDIGTLALRSPHDIINVVQTVLRFDHETSKASVQEFQDVSPAHRNFRISRVFTSTEGDFEEDSSKPKDKAPSTESPVLAAEEGHSPSPEERSDNDDGFIAF